MRVLSLPVATKLVALSVGISVVLSVSLTAIGYAKASQGLHAQAEFALSSDAQLVATGIDAWSSHHLHSAQELASVPAVARLTQQGADASDEDAFAVNQTLVGMMAGSGDGDSFTISNVKGIAVATNKKENLGRDFKSRDFFTEALKGHNFVSGMSIGVSTNTPSLFFSTPIRTADGKVVGVINNKADNPPDVQQLVDAARDRVGSGARGVLLDEQGLVIASSVDQSWMLRPVVALDPNTLAGMAKDQRWGKNPPPEPLGDATLGSVIGTHEPTLFDWRLDGTDYRAIAVPLATGRWTYVAALPVETVDAPVRDFLRTAVLAGVVGVVLATLLALLLARPLSRAVRQLTRAARGLAEGDLEQRVDVGGADEIGVMGEAVRQTIAYQRRMASVADAIAQGDLTREVQPQSERDVLGVAFAEMTRSLRQLVGEVRTSAEGLAETARQVSSATGEAGDAAQQVTQAIQQVAAGARETSAGAQTTSESMTALTEAVDGIARGATDQARQVEAASGTASAMVEGVAQVAQEADQVVLASQQAKATAERGARAVEDTVVGMAEIQRVVSEAVATVEELGALGNTIGAVVETIDDIAEQTNLLALNAAIEAARAGEHGRGFAVVADEVRKLAERSQRETRQIGELIQKVRQSTDRAVAAMHQGAGRIEDGASKAEQAGGALAAILQAVDDTVERVTGIAASAQEMARDAEGVRQAMTGIDAVVRASSEAAAAMAAQSAQANAAIQTMAAVSEEQSAGTEQVSAAMEQMSAQVQEMSAQGAELAQTAEQLTAVVARFAIAPAEPEGAKVLAFRNAA